MDASSLIDGEALVCRRTCRIYYRSDDFNDLEELPDDIDDPDKYLSVPDQHDLDLERPVALAFAAEHLPDHYAEAREIFGRKGAFARFRGLLDRVGALDQWYAFENEAEDEALRDWCESNDLEVVD